MSLTTLIALWVLLGVLVILVILLASILVGFFYKVPYVPSATKQIKTMLDLVEIKAKDKVVDLGCGDGKLLMYAEKMTKGKSFDGYEIAPLPIMFFYLKKLFLRSKVTLHTKNFFKEDMSPYSVVLLYLFPETMDALLPKFEKELPKGARVVSNTFQFKNKKPTQVIVKNSLPGVKNNIFLYTF